MKKSLRNIFLSSLILGSPCNQEVKKIIPNDIKKHLIETHTGVFQVVGYQPYSDYSEYHVSIVVSNSTTSKSKNVLFNDQSKVFSDVMKKGYKPEDSTMLSVTPFTDNSNFVMNDKEREWRVRYLKGLKVVR